MHSGELLPGGMCQLLTRSRARYTAIGEACWGGGMNATICLALSQWEIPLKSRGVLHVLKGFTGLGPMEGRMDCWSIKWDWTKNLAPLLLPNPEGCLWFTVIAVNWVIEKKGIQLITWPSALWLDAAVKKMTLSCRHLGAHCRVFVCVVFFGPTIQTQVTHVMEQDPCS